MPGKLAATHQVQFNIVKGTGNQIRCFTRDMIPATSSSLKIQSSLGQGPLLTLLLDLRSEDKITLLLDRNIIEFEQYISWIKHRITML